MATLIAGIAILVITAIVVLVWRKLKPRKEKTLTPNEVQERVGVVWDSGKK